MQPQRGFVTKTVKEITLLSLMQVQRILWLSNDRVRRKGLEENKFHSL